MRDAFRYLLAKLYVWRVWLSPDHPRAVEWLDRSHDLHDRADPAYDPESWKDDART